MPFAVQRDGFIVAPYFDHLSYYFNRAWKPAADDTVSLMIKLADSAVGSVAGSRVSKELTAADSAKLREAVELCRTLLEKIGIARGETFLGTLNAGHPGGMLPLRPTDARSLHPARLPAGLYVADATLLPQPLGNPPILTVMALADRVARVAASGGA